MAEPSETTRVSEAPPTVEERELLDAVRSLAAQVGSLQEEVHALRSGGGALPVVRDETHGWDERPVASSNSPPWVRTLDSPGTRRPDVPWLALELVFLVAVAVIAAVARLDVVAIVVVMAAAWALVAVAEWIASREAAKRELALLRSGLATAIGRDDSAWFAPPPTARATDLGLADEDTAARLPPPA